MAAFEIMLLKYRFCGLAMLTELKLVMLRLVYYNLFCYELIVNSVSVNLRA